jgi:hypothetical protein
MDNFEGEERLKKKGNPWSIQYVNVGSLLACSFGWLVIVCC